MLCPEQLWDPLRSHEPPHLARKPRSEPRHRVQRLLTPCPMSLGLPGSCTTPGPSPGTCSTAASPGGTQPRPHSPFVPSCPGVRSHGQGHGAAQVVTAPGTSPAACPVPCPLRPGVTVPRVGGSTVPARCHRALFPCQGPASLWSERRGEEGLSHNQPALFGGGEGTERGWGCPRESPPR